MWIRSKIEAAQSVALPSSVLSKACQYALTLCQIHRVSASNGSKEEFLG
jgi:hypothetical protein